MIRLFVALRPPAPIRDALADIQDGVAEARWQDDEQLHMTLRFVGEVERPQAEDLADAMQRLRCPATEARLQGVGAFGGRGRAGALWAGVTPREPIAALHRKVDQLCVQVGLEPERRAFTPHVTVARLPRGAGVDGPEVAAWRARHSAFATEPFLLDRVILYRSHLGRAGASYEPVVETPLG
ncbi:RNA 2',3'-cyclic phosphodiesterase [Sphingomonas lenta]|uniref:RNA 2',3'-cyclic phosphodiesterase n=1 Tax=Sphingomonas lenta TaxID=1141887 RepID=A0A2A2SHR7_9SPHN|nr:RNA 2',3'-cyclic phosphodiesterase [Sphingomonas lenta]PAX08786.1 RNA 2',3'-cyclic phosphodiesterase [Sphingomonas lenta]